ncbi:MAG: hypothetical protein HY904_18500 [Deltaproteobacteria bacterium]|nr:hypothetical protein [Deltaproteobacteria bacterium]
MSKTLAAVCGVVVTGFLAGLACGSSKAEQKPEEKTETGAPAAAAAEAPKPCDLFKQDCAEGQACTFAQGQSVCVASGAAKDGDPCKTGNDCGKGLFCTSAGCKAICDAAHPCAGGVNCTMFTNNNTLGACQ